MPFHILLGIINLTKSTVWNLGVNFPFSSCFQIADALDFLSAQVYHHNICPSSVLVTKLGNWKLAGMEFLSKHCTFKSSLKKQTYDLVLSALQNNFEHSFP